MLFTRLLLLLSLLVVLAGTVPPTQASCNSSSNRSFVGYPISLQTPNADNLLGSFWALGSGDPVAGMGHDNGTWPAVYQDNYGWLKYPNYYYRYISGSWLDPIYAGTVDGCISDLPAPDDHCMAILLTDLEESSNEISLAFITAAGQGNPIHTYDFSLPGGASIELTETPTVHFSSIFDDEDVPADPSLPVMVPTIDEAEFLDPACGDDGILGYKVYILFEDDWELPPELLLDNGDPENGWRLVEGGTGLGGEPIPLGQETTVFPQCPSGTGSLYGQPDQFGTPYPRIGYTLVFDSGYETPYVSLLRNAWTGPGTQDRFRCCTDMDADGFCTPSPRDPETVIDYYSDCDDEDDTVYAGAPELCDGVAHDCDNPNWPIPPTTSDQDGDGLAGCEGDCDDWDVNTYPGAPELCDGFAQNCNAPNWPMPLDINDHDGDGFTECTGDCNELDATVYPGAPELCDRQQNDCSGPWPGHVFDNDHDGFSECEGDCDDTSRDIYPGAPDLCDGVARDCDDPTWPLGRDVVDNDGDGFAECAGDCDDAADDIYPGAPELCDGVAHDCDAVGWPVPPGLIDADGDTFAECEGDCDDSDPAANPLAFEICNGVDDNCDGRSDEAPQFMEKIHSYYDNAHFGLRVDRLHDWDADGVGDFIAGARLDSWGGSRVGTAIVYSGAVPHSISRLHHPDEQGGDYFGSSVAGIGDVSGDGIDDILVGAEHDTTSISDAGSAHIFSGASPFPHLHMLTDPDGATGDRFGYNVAALGDLTGDGVDEFIVGSRGDDLAAGSTTVFNGATRGVLIKLTDPTGQPNDLFGYINAGVGDLNSDDVPDILVGAYGAEKVIAFSGADFSIIDTLSDPTGTTGEQFGRGLAVLGDVTGDGVDDILVGAPEKGSGTVSLFSGATRTLIDFITDTEGSAGDRFGYHVAGLGDLDSDGLPDILVGAFGEDTGVGANTGSASVFSGATFRLIRKLTDPEGEQGDVFGFSGAGVDDLDGDGVPDFVIGAYLDDDSPGEDAGTITLFSGAMVLDLDGDGTGNLCDGDADGDGLINAEDCAPLNGDVDNIPATVGATLQWSSDRTELWWQPVDQVARYNVYRGVILEVGGLLYDPACLSSPLVNKISTSSTPAYGEFYLVAGENECGKGSLGTDSENIKRLNPNPCP